MVDPNKTRLAGALALLLLTCGAAPGAEPADAPLVQAARYRDAHAVRALLAQNADVNQRSNDGSTALLWLAHWNDFETAQLLVGAGANPNIANDFLMTPLSQACTNSSAAFVRLLLRAGSDPNARIETGETPLHTCSRTGAVEAVLDLIEFGAKVQATEPEQNQTALMWAAAERHPDVVQALIKAKADLDARSKKGFAPIHFSARVGDLDSVKLFLAAGVDVNVLTGDKAANGETSEKTADGEAGDKTTDEEGDSRRATEGGLSPLMIATLRAQVDLALYLLDHGADPNLNAAGYLPLHWAAATWEGFASNPVYGFIDPMSGIPNRADKLRLVKALIAHGADVNARMTGPKPSFATGYSDTDGATAFLLASSVDDVEMMKILLEAGADPTIKTETNATAIMAATGLNHGIGESMVTEKEALEAVNLLLGLGLDPKGAVTTGENALFGPAYRGWNTLLAQLVNLGVDVNAVSKAGVTPYRAANGEGDRLGGVLINREGVEILLKAGADPTLGKVCEAQNTCK
jgi:ankyrin repeat protein